MKMGKDVKAEQGDYYFQLMRNSNLIPSMRDHLKYDKIDISKDEEKELNKIQLIQKEMNDPSQFKWKDSEI